MKSNFLRWFAILLILETGLLHIMTAQAEYEEAAYMGYLFAANFFGALLAAYGIYRRGSWGWLLGLVIAVGSIFGYSWSRTLGMPGMEVEEWQTPYGVVALTVETAFALLFVLRQRRGGEESLRLAPLNFKSVQVWLSAFLLFAVSISTYRWDAAVTQAFGLHIVSLEQAIDASQISTAELEEEYGVQVALVATSMMGSILDVRLKIVDPDKAHALLKNQAALLVGEQALILAPHMHSHTGSRLKPGKIYVMFFPTEQIVAPGSEVALVFGSVRLEPVMVR